MKHKKLKTLSWAFRWRMTDDKYEFLIKNKDALEVLDDEAIKEYKGKWSFSDTEKRLLKLSQRKESMKEYGVLFNLSHKEWCNSLVARALKYGHLGKEPCALCRTDNNIQGHHEDYREPLEVIWLCGSCHQKRHAVIRKQITLGTYSQSSIASKSTLCNYENA